jgi:hypothetical protein
VDVITGVVRAVYTIITQPIGFLVGTAVNGVTVVNGAEHVVLTETVTTIVLTTERRMADIRCTSETVITIGIGWDRLTPDIQVAEFGGTRNCISGTIVWVGVEHATIGICSSALLRGAEVITTGNSVLAVGVNRVDLATEEATAFVDGTEGAVIASRLTLNVCTACSCLANAVGTVDSIVTERIDSCMDTGV